MDERKGRRVIFFPLPFPGHFNPMIQLAGIFLRRGFAITVLHTSFNFPDVSRHPNFTFRFLRGRENDPRIQTEGSEQPDLLSILRDLEDSYAAPFRESLSSELAEADGGEPVVCLISDAIWGFTEAVADEVGVRRIVLRTGGATSFRAFAAFPLLRDKGYLPIQNYRLDEVLPGLQPLKVKDLPAIQTAEPEELYRIVNNMVNGVKSSSGVIWNTFEDLEGSSLENLRHQLQVPIFPIGPFHKHGGHHSPPTNDDDFITSWLDKQEPKSVVYVSFGSLAAIDEKEFLEIAWGLSNSEQRFLWVVRPGSVRGTEWLEALPCGFMEHVGERGKIAKWVNQQGVLTHRAIGAFWTHCGWNSTLESICEGVPMICMPCFTDQHANARYICDVWKIGVPLERNKMDRREAEKMIRRMMVEEQGDEMRKRGLKLKDKANLCVRQDGSSYKSLDNLVNHVLSFDSFTFNK